MINQFIEQRQRVAEFQSKHRIGLLTLLFTDIVGSTQMKQELGDQKAIELLQAHNSLLRNLLQQYEESEEIGTAGDSFFIVFSKPSDAVKFSLQLQAQLRIFGKNTRRTIQDRIGIHVGEVFIEASQEPGKSRDLYGLQVDTCARVMSLAEGGQILMLRSSFDNARQVLAGQSLEGVDKLSWRKHGQYMLKGLDEAVEICEVGEESIAPLKAPQDSEKAYRKVAPIFTDDSGRQAISVPSAPSKDDQRNLNTLCERVRQFWIEGILEKTVWADALISLGKKTMVGAVEHPWERLLELPDQTSHDLPSTKRIDVLFDEVGRFLLILGEPGSGKTVTLLELAKELIKRCQDETNQPIPVVFNLSSWEGTTRTVKSFKDWLIEELKVKYHVPAKIGEPLLEQGRLLLLLDGFDEMKPEHRPECIKAINQYAEEHSLPGLVISSRLEEYTSLSSRFKLNAAICLQSLTPEQVGLYLSQAGKGLSELREVMKQDASLQELAKSPLMLGIMSLAYQDKPAADLISTKGESAERRRERIFNTYVERMFERKGKKQFRFSAHQTKNWLSQLACKMRQHSQSVFLMEQLQPSWLSTPTLRLAYILITRAVMWIILLVPWIILMTGEKNALFSLYWIVGFTITLTLRNGSYVKSYVDTSDIQTIESLHWSWQTTLKGICGGSIGGIFLVLFAVVLSLPSGKRFKEIINFDMFYFWIGMGMFFAITIAFPWIFIGSLRGGLIKTKMKPNEGIVLTIRNSVIALLGSLVMLATPLIVLKVITNDSVKDIKITSWEVWFITTITIWIGAYYGGYSVLKHYLLRLILTWNHITPLRFRHFLDHSTQLIFLRRAGGGYVFIHRLLLEYFADRNKPQLTCLQPSPEQESQSKQYGFGAKLNQGLYLTSPRTRTQSLAWKNRFIFVTWLLLLWFVITMIFRRFFVLKFPESDIFSAFLIYFILAICDVIRWIYGKAVSDKLLLDCGPMRGRAFALVVSWLSSGIIMLWFYWLGFALVRYIYFIVPILIILLSLWSQGLARLQIRESGIWLHTWLLRWTKIQSYRWEGDTGHTLILETGCKLPINKIISVQVPEKHKASAQDWLQQKIKSV